MVGAIVHGLGVTLTDVLQTAAPLWLAWVILARWRDPYTGPLGNLLLVWLLALPLGVVFRALLLGEVLAFAQVPFMLTAMAFTLPLMLLGRWLA